MKHFWITLMLLIIGQINLCLASVNTLLGNSKKSHLQFEPVRISSSGNIRFRFKTTEPNGFLLYADDQLNRRGSGNFVRLDLKNKKLAMFFQVSDEHMKEKYKRVDDGDFVIGDNLNDDRYHYVEISIVGAKIILKLDEMVKTYTTDLNKALLLSSHVYIGGLPATLKILGSQSLLFQERFTGCVGMLHYNSGNYSTPIKYAKVIESKDTIPGCLDRCQAEQPLKCENRGRCLNMYTNTGCDCRGTGFTGKTCTKGSTSLQYPGYSHLTWTPKPDAHSLSTEIMLRFKTARSSGILLSATGGQAEYLLLELYQKSLVLISKIHGHEEEMIQLGDHNISHASWRFVKVKVDDRKVSLQLNDGITERQYSREQSRKSGFLPSNGFRSKTFYIGGNVDPTLTSKSKGKSHFIGCMQDVVINQIDLIALFKKEKTFTETIDKTINTEGEITEGCSVDVFTGADFHQVNPGQHSSIYASYISGQKTKIVETSTNSFSMWIVISACIGVVLTTIVVVTVIYVRRKRIMKARNYSERYLRQTTMSLPAEDVLPTEQKCIREEIAKRRLLKTFSPVRKEFYVSPSDTVSMQRSINEPIYQSHDVLHHNHPYVGHNFVNPMARHQTPQQHAPSLQNVTYSSSSYHHSLPQHAQRRESPGSSYIGTIDRKCSHGSRYQVPNMVIRRESLKSSISQQSSSFYDGGRQTLND